MLVFAAALTCAGCQPRAAPPEPLSEADATAIRDLARSYFEAVIGEDASALSALYADDAVLMPPYRPAIEGRAAIEAALALPDAFNQGLSYWGITLSPDARGGEWVYDWGTYALLLAPDSVPLNERRPDLDTMPDSVAHAGKYLVVLRRQVDGSWLIAREIWTKD
jgi:ketosteroid isomerase-like protein